MCFLCTGCSLDKNTEGPVYGTYDIVEVYTEDDDTEDNEIEDDAPSTEAGENGSVTID